VEALTKQNGVRLFGKLKKSLKKKLKPTYPNFVKKFILNEGRRSRGFDGAVVRASAFHL
jgi:hypothetical protein